MNLMNSSLYEPLKRKLIDSVRRDSVPISQIQFFLNVHMHSEDCRLNKTLNRGRQDRVI